MRSFDARALVLVGTILAGSALPAPAQDQPAPKLSLSGTYDVSNASVGDVSVSLDFKATVTNLGESDVLGVIVLRHPNVIQKIWERFGDQSISAGGSVSLSASVTIPREEYDNWIKGGGPGLYFNTQNDRGEIKTFRIPLSQIPAK